MGKKPKEWFDQAEYDMDTAEFMFKGGRLFYSVFMCHLAVEKALKGSFSEKFEENPPKTHNLTFLVEQLQLTLPENLSDFVQTLNGVSVPTRYPDNLKRILKDFDKEKTRQILKTSKELLKWLKTVLM
jgi:HEPN domain-containing protein